MPSSRIPPDVSEQRAAQLAVLTCAARAGAYLTNTLRSIDLQGGKALPRRVYVDGNAEQTHELVRSAQRDGGFVDWEWVALQVEAESTSATPFQLGSTLAFQRVLRHAVQNNGNADLIFCEDDLLLCRNAVARMAQLAVPPRVGLVTFVDMKEVAAGAAPGLHRAPALGSDGRGFWGAQSLKLPASVVTWLVAQDWSQFNLPHPHMASDLLLGELVARHPERRLIAVHVPNLVQHIGYRSVCFPGLSLSQWRRASNFPGESFDALTLPAMG